MNEINKNRPADKKFMWSKHFMSKGKKENEKQNQEQSDENKSKLDDGYVQEACSDEEEEGKYLPRTSILNLAGKDLAGILLCISKNKKGQKHRRLSQFTVFTNLKFGCFLSLK
jgi:hypothetical protein